MRGLSHSEVNQPYSTEAPATVIAVSPQCDQDVCAVGAKKMLGTLHDCALTT